ncbi:hypothetical protein SAMN05444166_4684 [Singulisphaera sp. GP187]|nr:hypothetical protein SAMN05444166_4684 [Singulisphaera sp. GP187]
MSLKKLDIGGPYRGYIHQHMIRNHFELLSIADEHLSGIVDLPFHHKDPFDRLLLARVYRSGLARAIDVGTGGLGGSGVSRPQGNQAARRFLRFRSAW